MAICVWRLLGFDARENEQDAGKSPIPADIRNVMLIRPDIEFPFSVDTNIWPSHFLYHPHIQTYSRDPSLILVGEEFGCDFWLNLKKMRDLLAENGRTAIVVAVELLAPPKTDFAEFGFMNIHSETEPSSVPEGSICLGFDVADSGFWSGMSNCGFTEDERGTLVPKWRDKLNDFGLLKSEEDAREFKELSDRRVPEHAPFWVYRLSRLPDL